MRAGAMGFYVTSVVVAGLALWGILAKGERLSAVRDLSGTWTLMPTDQWGKVRPDEAEKQLTVDQSGRFLRLTAGKTTADVKLMEATAGGGTASEGTARYLLAGADASATFEPTGPGDVWKLTLTGLQPGVYWATRPSVAPDAGTR